MPLKTGDYCLNHNDELGEYVEYHSVEARWRVQDAKFITFGEKLRINREDSDSVCERKWKRANKHLLFIFVWTGQGLRLFIFPSHVSSQKSKT